MRFPLRQLDGPLTRQLVQEPGGFGLGCVPARLKPDATTTSVCGFCSTGCNLKIHLKDGEAISLTPSTDYPVNLGMACPKGWESLSVLRTSDRVLALIGWPTFLNVGSRFLASSASLTQRAWRASFAPPGRNIHHDSPHGFRSAYQPRSTRGYSPSPLPGRSCQRPTCG